MRAYVRSADKARKVLGCSKCDESEGIYLGNVSNESALLRAAAGASAVAIAVGVSGLGPPGPVKGVEFTGVQNTVAALGTPANIAAAGGLGGLRVVLCSSMGTTTPDTSKDAILFWKLNAEAFVGASGMPFAIVKPCGLLETPGNKSHLLTGKDDSLLAISPPIVSRTDVAAVMAAALARPGEPRLRFDLCSKAGEPQRDLQKLLDETEYPWQQ